MRIVIAQMKSLDHYVELCNNGGLHIIISTVYDIRLSTYIIYEHNLLIMDHWLYVYCKIK